MSLFTLMLYYFLFILIIQFPLKILHCVMHTNHSLHIGLVYMSTNAICKLQHSCKRSTI